MGNQFLTKVINSQITGLKPALCIPSDVKLNGMAQAFEANGIRVVTERMIDALS